MRKPFAGREPLPEELDFVGAVRWAAGRVGSSVEEYDGEHVDLSGRLQGKIALTDLFAQCRLSPRKDWNRIVYEAFHGLAMSSTVDLGTLELTRPLLRTRVYAEGAVLADDVVTTPLAEGLVEVLVVEMGGAVRTVPGQVHQGWGEPDLMGLAREQTLDSGLLSRSTLDLEGVELTTLESTGPFTATHVHRLEAYLDVPPEGALLALPTRHLLLAAPVVTRQQSLEAAQTLLVNADQLWREGPGGLTPDLYWWRAGTLTLLPGSPTSLRPPMAFLEVLDGLAS